MDYAYLDRKYSGLSNLLLSFSNKFSEDVQVGPSKTILTKEFYEEISKTVLLSGAVLGLFASPQRFVRPKRLNLKSNSRLLIVPRQCRCDCERSYSLYWLYRSQAQEPHCILPRCFGHSENGRDDINGMTPPATLLTLT